MDLNLNIFKNKSERNDFLIAMLVLGLFGIFLFSKMNGPRIPQAELVPMAEKELNSAINTLETETEKPIRIYTDENVNLANSETELDANEALDSLNILPLEEYIPKDAIPNDGSSLNLNETETISELEKPELDAVKPTLSSDELPLDYDSIRNAADELIEQENAGSRLENTTEKLGEEVKETISETSDAIEEKTEQVASNVSKVVETVKPTNSSQKTNDFEASGTRSKCVIVVGAFKNPDNVSSVKKELIDAGFDYQTGNVRNKRYIGVPVTCGDKSEIASTKDGILRRLEIEGWLYKEK